MKSLHRSLIVGFNILKTVQRNILGIKFEPETRFLSWMAGPGSICLDVGGSYGRYLYLLSRLVGPAGRVHSFEPGSESYAALSAIKRIHGLKNATIVKKAVTDKAGVSRLVVPIKVRAGGRHGLSLAYVSESLAPHCVSESIETTSLDAYCSENAVGRVDFIKCDVEGGEFLVLKGAFDILNRDKPSLLCEVNDGFIRDKFKNTSGSILDLLLGRGYSAFELVRDRLRPARQAVNGNYFFVHPSSPSFEKFRNL